eukprot:gene6823-10988_t
MKSVLFLFCCLCLFVFVLANEEKVASATKTADDYIKEAYEKLSKDPKTMDFINDYGKLAEEFGKLSGEKFENAQEKILSGLMGDFFKKMAVEHQNKVGAEKKEKKDEL